MNAREVYPTGVDEFMRYLPSSEEVEREVGEIVSAGVTKGVLGMLTYVDGMFSETLYVFRHAKKDRGETLIRFCLFRSEKYGSGTEFVSDLFCYNYNAGYYYAFSEEEKQGMRTADFVSVNRIKHHCNVSSYRSYTETMKIDPVFRYIDAEELERQYCGDVLKGIERARKYTKQMEFILKNMEPELIRNVRWLTMSREKASKVMAYSRKSGIPLRNLPLIEMNMARGNSAEESVKSTREAMERSQDLFSLRHSSGIGTLGEKDLDEAYRYAKKQGSEFREYCGYLDSRRELGMGNTSHSARFPSNLPEAKEAIIQEKQKRKQTQSLERFRYEQRFREGFRKAVHYEKNGGYTMFTPLTRAEFVRLGTGMDNCVGSFGYFESQFDGGCLIIGIFMNGRPEACLELSRDEQDKAQVKQLYGVGNMKVSDRTKRFVEEKILPRMSGYFSNTFGTMLGQRAVSTKLARN